MSKNRRKIIVVNKDVQRRIVLSVALLPTLSLTVATLIVAVFCRRLLGEAMQTDAHLPSLVPLFVSMLGFVVVSAAIVLHHALRFSHRIAGPSYRLIKSMERLRSGDVSFRVHLRNGDHLGEVADAFNQVLDWLERDPPPSVGQAMDVVEAPQPEELPEVCGGRPATRDAMLEMEAAETPPAPAANTDAPAPAR